MKLEVNIQCNAIIIKNHAHGNDVRSAGRKIFAYYQRGQELRAKLLRMLVIRNKQPQQTSGASRTNTKIKTEITMAEFNDQSSLISATKIPLPDTAAALDALSTIV